MPSDQGKGGAHNGGRADPPASTCIAPADGKDSAGSRLLPSDAPRGRAPGRSLRLVYLRSDPASSGCDPRRATNPSAAGRERVGVAAIATTGPRPHHHCPAPHLPSGARGQDRPGRLLPTRSNRLERELAVLPSVKESLTPSTSSCQLIRRRLTHDHRRPLLLDSPGELRIATTSALGALALRNPSLFSYPHSAFLSFANFRSAPTSRKRIWAAWRVVPKT